MSLKKVIQDIGLVGVTEIISSASGIILVAVLTKSLGIYSYGLWEQIAVTVGILDPFASFGLNNALIRFLPAKKLKTEKKDMFYSILLFKFLISSIISLLLILFSEYLANAFFGGNIEIVKLISVIFIIGGATVVCQFYLQSVRKIKLYSILRLSGRIIEIVSIFVIILLGYDLIGVLLSVIIVRSIFLIIYFFFIILEIGISIPHFTEIKALLRYGIPLIPTSFSVWVITFSDRYMIAYMMGVSYVGSYSVGYTIGFTIFMLVVVINFVLIPVLSKMFDEGKMAEVKKYLKYSLKYYLLFAIPTIFGLSILSKQILTIITTSVVAEEAWIIPPIIASAALFAGIHDTFEKSLRLTKKTKKIGLTVTIGAIVNFSLNLLLIPLIGILGAAIATLISYMASTGLIIFFSFKEIRFEIEKFFLPKAIFASILMAFIGWIWRPVGIISVILCILVCIIIYFSVMFLLNVFEQEEIEFIKNLVKFGNTKNK